MRTANVSTTHTKCCRLDSKPGVAISLKILCNKRGIDKFTMVSALNTGPNRAI